MQVNYYKNVHVNDIQLNPPKKLNNKYRSSVHDKRLFVQSPPNIHGTIIEENNGTKTFDINLTNETSSFIDFITSIDEHCIGTICEHSEEWFSGRKLCDDAVRRGFRSALTVGRDGSHLHTKFQYDAYGDEITCIFDEFSNVYDNIQVGKEYRCSVIIEFNGCWFGKSEMRSEWSIAQIKIYDDTDANEPVEILPDSDSDEYYEPDDIMFDDDNAFQENKKN